MDKRGFTLIELLATVIIIAIIMTLILPSALRVSKKNSKRIYGEYENMMVEYAKVSLLNNQDLIDLIDLEELEKVKMECSGYVEIDHNTNPPQYSPYITCGDKYTTENYNRSYAKTIVPIPVCKNAIYNGNNQLLVESNEAYTITNGTRKDVGKQDVVLSLNNTNEYIWVDSTFENKTLNDCEIHKREIIVTADTKTMNYGESVPSNSYTIENAINGVNPLTSSVTYTYKDVNNNIVTVNSSTPVGIYNIVPNTSVSDNYSLVLENGVLIIMRNVNTMTVTNNQSWSTTFANSVQEKTFTGATNAQGTVTYTILSQNKGTTSVNYFSIPNNTTNKIQMAAGTPAGDYSVVISVTAQGDANHLENTMEITLNVTVGKASNSIAVTDTQSWSPTFSTSSQDKSFTAATGGQGSVTYAIQSQKKGSTTVSSFSIPTNTTATLRMAASTGVGTYTVVIRATAAGNSNYNSGYKDITMTVTVGKASNPISVTASQSWSEAFSTSAKTKAITAATGAQGTITYAIQSQPSGSYFTISGTTLTRKASTPVGTYSVVIRATAAGNDNYNSGYKDITMSVTVSKASNPISVTDTQSWSPTFSTGNQDKSFTAATSGQGSVTYAIQSQKKGSTTVSAFTIPTNTTATLRMAASTGVGTYTVVIRATAAGNDNYNSGYKDITMTVTVGKASNPISVTATQSWSPTFSTSNQDKSFTAAANAQGSVTYAIQSQKKGSTTVSSFSIPTNTTATLRMAASTGVGTYTVVIRATAAGNDNYNSGYKDITMTVTVSKASNPIAVTASQSWSEAFATSAKTKAITAATGAQGSVTYAIQSQPSGSYFTISGTTLTRKASTPAGSYSVVIRATAAGNDNYNFGYKDITMSVTVGRAGISFPTCTSVYYNGSSQTLFAAHTSGNYTNSAITGTNAGTYKGNLTPTANYQWSSGSNVTSARELSCVINASEALNTVNGVTTGYATLQAAFNASTTGTTKLLKDITGAISVAATYNKTIDFNNKKAGGLTNSGTVIIKNGKFEDYDSWIITNYATMTINDTSVNYTSVDTGCAIVNYKSGSTTPTMTLNNVTINSKSNSLDNDGGTMYATNVKITNDGSGVEVWNKHGGKITFTGGSVSAGNICAHDNCAAYNNSLANSNDLITIVNTTVGSTVKAFGKIIHIKTVTHNNLPFVMTGLLNYASSSDSLECPTWTTANGQDDIIWHGEEASVSPGLQAEQGGKYCYFARVNHNNETGIYSTHFYVNGKFVVGTSWTWN